LCHRFPRNREGYIAISPKIGKRTPPRENLIPLGQLRRFVHISPKVPFGQLHAKQGSDLVFYFDFSHSLLHYKLINPDSS
jgi:hypothetical protein